MGQYHRKEMLKDKIFFRTGWIACGGDGTLGGAADSSTTTSRALHVALPLSFSADTEQIK